MAVIRNYLKIPKFYEDFHCIGGECPYTCCQGWYIDWKTDEIEKILNSDCSEELKEKIKVSFYEREKDIFAVRFAENRNCPLLTEEGLCGIQKEIGHEYLSYTCSVYPRFLKLLGNFVIGTCTATCYEVTDILCRRKDSMDMVIRHSEGSIKCGVFNENAFEEKPYLKYLNDIFDFLYGILHSDKHSIETSIVMGALAAKKISELIESGQTDNIPTVLKKLKPQTESREQLASIEKIKPNPIFGIGVVNEIQKMLYGRDIMEKMYTDGKPDVSKFTEGTKKFEAAFAENSFAVKNLILNIFVECFSQKYSLKHTLYENYLYFAFSAAAIRLSRGIIGYYSNNIQRDYRLYICRYMRKIDSNYDSVDKTIDYLKEHKWTSPAYIASMIK